MVHSFVCIFQKSYLFSIHEFAFDIHHPALFLTDYSFLKIFIFELFETKLGTDQALRERTTQRVSLTIFSKTVFISTGKQLQCRGHYEENVISSIFLIT